DVVRNEHADDVGAAGILDLPDRKAVRLRLLARGVGAHAHARVEAGVAQVEGPRPPLVAVADQRDRLSGQRGRVGIGFPIDVSHAVASSPTTAMLCFSISYAPPRSNLARK